MTRVLRCNPAEPDKRTIKEALEALGSGLVVVFPTETQYSLSVRADDMAAMEKINRIKKRSEARRPALFVKDMAMAETFCRINETARKLADKFLPGPLTLVLPGRDGQQAVLPEFKSELGFGIRISSSPLIAGLMAEAPFAVTATSANISGQPTLEAVDLIRPILGDEVELYIDGGPCRGIVPSTVVSVGEGIEFLRHGLISEMEIRKYLVEEYVNG